MHNQVVVFLPFVLNALSKHSQVQPAAVAASTPKVQQSAVAALPDRAVFSLDHYWKFALGNAADRSLDFGYGTLGQDSKPGYPAGPGDPSFSDSSWRTVDLPHDWAAALPFVPDGKANVGHGSKPLGRNFPDASIGWYRKSFPTPPTNPGDRIRIRFDGVFQDATFWLNGVRITSHLDGYTPISFDATDFLRTGQPNILVVRVNATRGSGWFYEGAGIYRHVWLIRQPAVHIAEFSPFVSSKVTGTGAVVTVKTTVKNTSSSPARVYTKATVIAPNGTQAAGSRPARSEAVTIPAGSEATLTADVKVPHAELWSIEHPNMYSCAVDVMSAKGPLDQNLTPFGIRTIRFDANKGFFLNGKRVEIKGACDHQDAAGVGIAISDDLETYRIEQLKKYGFNALRTSHNAPDPALLEACDRLGFIVMDETRTFNSAPDGLSNLTSMVQRDRNHPSVIMWSVGNEEPLGPTPIGKAMAKTMKHAIHEYDTTRPVTMASNAGNSYDGANSVLDLRGWNYMAIGNIDKYHKDHPNQPMYGSEEASTLTDRGEYVNDPAKGYMSGYDENHPGWGSDAEQWWNFFEPRPYLAGGFVWTGFDYRGEPTPYGWPCISSHFGVLDTCGFPKDVAYYYKAWWTDEPVVHIAPTWDFTGDEGKVKKVWIESNCDAVDLKLNGKDLGTKKVVPLHHLEWQVPYEPGVLEAIGLKKGAQACIDKQVTPGAPTSIDATADRSQVPANGDHTVVVNIAETDAAGNLCLNASEMLNFSLSGAKASIIGVGNGDPSCHEPDQFIQKPTSMPVTEWQMAKVPNGTLPSAELPKDLKLDWTKTSVANDGGQLRDSNTEGVFRADFTLSQDDISKGLTMLSIGQIDDIGDVYLNGHFLGHTTHWDQSWSYPVSEFLKPGANEILIWVQNQGGSGGLGQTVTLTGPGQPAPWSRSLFHGLAQVIIRVGDLSGTTVLHIQGKSGLVKDVPIELTPSASIARL